METYLGESSSDYNNLVSKSIVDNEIEQFNIKNSRGDFTGYKVEKDGEQGYAYYHSEGSFFEFSPENECNVTLLQKQLVTTRTALTAEQSNEAIFAMRNERTKHVSKYQVEFTGTNLMKSSVEATKAKHNNEDGFIYSQQIKHHTLPELDRTQNVFINKSNVNVLERKNSYKLLSHKEKMAEQIEDRKSQYHVVVDFFKNNNIDLKDIPNEKDYVDRLHYSVDSVVKKIENFIEKYNTNSFIKTYNDISHLSDDITKETNTQNTLAIQNKLNSEFGFHIEVTEDFCNEQFSLDIKDENGKKLSSLILSDAFYDYEQVIGTDERNNDIEVDVSFTTLDLYNECEVEDKEIKIYESGSFISLEDSKYKEFYELFNNIAFTCTEEVEEHGCETVINEYDDSFNVENVDLSNKLEANHFAKETLDNNPTIANKFSNKNSNKNKKK
jgi:hypothetical protein